MKTDSQHPPIALVKTWVGLINSNEEKQIKEHATAMLMNAFGDLQSAVAYCRQHNIRIQ